MFLLAFSLLNLVLALDQALVEKEKLSFLERTIVQVLSKGQFPEIVGAETQVLVNCGCTYATMNVNWGSQVGMFCKLETPGYEEACGKKCVSPKGDDVLLLCPEGWTSDCRMGCTPPRFQTTVQRVQFLENNVDSIIRYGYDYGLLVTDYFENVCKCKNSRVFHIRYGSKLGYDCVLTGTPDPKCRAWGPCKTKNGEEIQMFCPAGYVPSCTGCHKSIDFGTDLDRRIDWCIEAMTGYIVDTEVTLDLVPTNMDVVSCGCTDLVQKVTYGYGIGYSCRVDKTLITEDCRTRYSICRDYQNNPIVHFCPSGFVANCEVGCAHWWKLEL